jgi:hypothetical protein
VKKKIFALIQVANAKGMNVPAVTVLKAMTTLKIAVAAVAQARMRESNALQQTVYTTITKIV